MRLLQFLLGLVLALTVHSLLHSFFPNALAFVDVYVILVVFYALGRNLTGTIFAGVAAGFVQDAFSGSIFGLHAFSLTLCGYLVAVIASKIVMRNALAFLGALAGSVVVNELVIYVLVNILQHQRIELASHQLVLKMIMTSLIGALTYQLVAVLIRKGPTEAEGRRFRS